MFPPLPQQTQSMQPQPQPSPQGMGMSPMGASSNPMGMPQQPQVMPQMGGEKPMQPQVQPSYPAAPQAKQMSQFGRGNDTMLMHVTPSEVNGLQQLAQMKGGSLTTNPTTGLPEAGFLEDMLPTILGVAGSFFGIPPMLTAAVVGGGTAMGTGSLEKGLMAGLGAFGGSGIAGGLGLGAAGAGATPALTTGAQTLNAAGNAALMPLTASVPTASAATPLASFGQQAGQQLANFGQGFAGEASKNFAGAPQTTTNLYKTGAAALGAAQPFMNAMQPRYAGAEAEDDGFNYEGPYLPTERRARFKPAGSENDSSEFRYFDDVNPYPGFAPAPRGFAKGGDVPAPEVRPGNLDIAPGAKGAAPTMPPMPEVRPRYLDIAPGDGGIFTLPPGPRPEVRPGNLEIAPNNGGGGQLPFPTPPFVAPAPARRITRPLGYGDEYNYGTGGGERRFEPPAPTLPPPPPLIGGGGTGGGTMGGGGGSGGFNFTRDDLDRLTSYVRGFGGGVAPREVTDTLVGPFPSSGGGGSTPTPPVPPTPPTVDPLLPPPPPPPATPSVRPTVGSVYQDETFDVGYAAGGPVPLDNGAFIIDARTVSELGNGSSSAGQELLARYGGMPIRGKGDGVSDSIPAKIDGRQPARVARDEVKFDPEAVRRFGGGDHALGVKRLHALMDKAHKARKGAARGEDTKLRKAMVR